MRTSPVISDLTCDPRRLVAPFGSRETAPCSRPHRGSRLVPQSIHISWQLCIGYISGPTWSPRAIVGRLIRPIRKRSCRA